MTQPTPSPQTGKSPDCALTSHSINLHTGVVVQSLFRLKALLSLELKRGGAWIGLLVIAHVASWWLVALVANAPLGIHNDMAEAFSWGRELQWGYYKHPPFWAWIARLWFSIFPTTTWAFYLLSAVNSAIGLLGVWAIAGRYVVGAPRLAAVLMLELVPFHHLYAFNYNANSIQLSLWPWAIYLFIVSFERRTLVASAGFGVLAAAAMLSKYFGGVLLMGCFIAAVTNPRASQYLRSPAPYLSMLAFGICMAPHLAWSFEAVSGPVDYLATKTHYPYRFIFLKAASFVVESVLLHCLLVTVLFGICWKLHCFEMRLSRIDVGSSLRDPKVRLVVMLATAPFATTVLVSLIGHVRIGMKFALPLFSLLPLMWIILYRVQFGLRSLRLLALAVGILIAGSALFAVPTAALKFKQNDRHFAEPRAIVAQRLTDLWHERIGTPLRIVAGTEGYALATTFYSADHPSDFTGFSTIKAPWINDARLSRNGLAIVCAFSDGACLDQLGRFQALDSIRLTLNDVSDDFLGIAGTKSSFVVLLVKPGQTVLASTADCCVEASRVRRSGRSPFLEDSRPSSAAGPPP